MAADDSTCVSPYDPLTGFGNRQMLFDDLERAVSPAGLSIVLAIFDVGGYGEYQRVFGERAADVLVARISAVFQTCIGQAGMCYRPRKDEFVALIRGTIANVEPLLERTVRALRHEGEAFLVTSSFGVAQLPDEADEPIAAMALADERLGLISGRPPRERRENPRSRDYIHLPSTNPARTASARA